LLYKDFILVWNNYIIKDNHVLIPKLKQVALCSSIPQAFKVFEYNYGGTRLVGKLPRRVEGEEGVKEIGIVCGEGMSLGCGGEV